MQLKLKIKMLFNLSETTFLEVKSFFMIIVLQTKKAMLLWLLKSLFNFEVKKMEVIVLMMIPIAICAIGGLF